MFTGIVTQRATVTDAPAPGAPGAAVRLRVALERPVDRLAPGDSVALDGCCLTVVSVEGTALAFDVVPETLRRTTLGDRRLGDRVNVETALRAGDPIGGHIVQGHVEGVGRIEEAARRGDDVRMTIALPDALRGAAVEKGSIAIDGVSLTVGEAEERRVSVYLVPHTLAATGLGEKRAGERVNLEADVLGRYVEHHLRRGIVSAPVPAREAIE